LLKTSHFTYQGNVGRPTRTRAELVTLLAEQRSALAASCASYDRGNEWEAARLATSVFTLFHDGGSTRSLLTQLGLRASLRFVSTGRYWSPPDTRYNFVPVLLGAHLSAAGAKFLPRYQIPIAQPAPTRVEFETWWSKEDIYGSGGVKLSRCRLVFALRHQDGGGHVGDLTDPAYISLKTRAGRGSDANGDIRYLSGSSGTMRQIAWEVTETLKQLGDVA
jgi:hypothetical protein